LSRIKKHTFRVCFFYVHQTQTALPQAERSDLITERRPEMLGNEPRPGRFIIWSFAATSVVGGVVIVTAYLR
jgi:hypothetical protein